MNDFEQNTVKEITRTTILSQKDLDKLNNIVNNNHELSRDTSVIVGEKKGFFKRIKDAIKSPQPDTLKQISSHSQTSSADFIVPTKTDTVAEFFREVNQAALKKNAALVVQVIQRQNELYTTNEQTIAQINKIMDEIELREYRSHLDLIWEREATLKRSSNGVAFIAFLALAIAIIFMSWTIYSITASQRLQREIEKAKIVVENLLISREQLLLTITHDIKAPISSIIGYLELMKKDKPTAKMEYYIENMQQSSVHILDLVRDLLDFYSLDHGQQKINPMPFSPYMLVSNVYESFIPDADKKELNLKLEMGINPDVDYISDPYRIRQILNNLLSNAVKYTPEKGFVTLSASIETKKDNAFLILSVRDTGSGIKEKDKTKIFEEFRRLEYTGVGVEGLGLGLNISNKLSQLLGGSIEIDSTWGKGSVFTLKIPLRASGEEKNIDRNVKILFIDDDVVQLNLLAELMKRENIAAYTCSNALDALQLIQEEQFDIIFSDIQMADMNGFELVERIRAATFNHSSQIPIIGLSAHSHIPEAKYKEAGFSGFLSKPFTTEQLFDIILLYANVNYENSEKNPDMNAGFVALTQFAGSDTEAENRIIRSFIDENNKNLELLEGAFEEKNWKTVADISHKMISLMKMIAAKELVSLLQDYEMGSHSEENKLPLLNLIRKQIKEAEIFLEER
jgi:signal transduction histidine kinase/FixJ family two-component response regulator